MRLSRFDLLHCTRSLAILLALTGMVACADDPIEPESEPLPHVASAIVLDSDGPIFRSLHVELVESAAIEVFYAPAAGGRVLRMRSEGSSISHEILLPRLRQSTDYAYAVRAIDATRASDSIFRGTFGTGPLPAELLGFEYSVSGTSTFPLMMIPFRSTSLGWAGQVAIDSDGAIVWYMESAGGTLVAAPVPGTHDMVFIENGFPSDGGRNGIVRVNPDREVIALLERGTGDFGQIHHDMTAVDDDRVLFLAYDTMTVRDTVVTGESIWEWNTTTGAVEKKWSAWDFIDWDTERNPTAAPSAWLHANSITIGPRGNVVVSFRSINQVISIASDFQSLEWRVGGPGATVATSIEDRFISQHSAWELPGGHLLLFDNQGAGPADDHSRALELQIQQDTAWMVWQHDPEPPISAPLRGGVYRLANGNTATIFTALPFEVHETTPDGTVIWTMTGDLSFTTTFRAAPWSGIAGEVEVEAMP
ncbi:MAG TPA: aryl-sulfate sulfotransferase [Longimicrobiales bacterium]|nr:aryl-sulfate sulfotransferase [Longimicrobiales bacterium]